MYGYLPDSNICISIHLEKIRTKLLFFFPSASFFFSSAYIKASLSSPQAVNVLI